MDEKYIQELYSGLGGTEVLGDYKDFYNLITNDDTYIQDIHSSFGEETLGDYNDFYNLVKKKDEPGVSPTKDEEKDTTLVSDTATTEAGPSDVSALTEDKDVVKTEEITEQITEEKAPEITAATAEEYGAVMREPLTDTELAEIEEELTEEFEESGFKDTIGKYYNALKEKADESKGDEFAKWVFSKLGDYKTYKQEAVAKAEKQLKEEGGGVTPPLEQIVERAKTIRRNELLKKKIEYKTVENIDELWDMKSPFMLEGTVSIAEMEEAKKAGEKVERLKQYNLERHKELPNKIRREEASLAIMQQDFTKAYELFLEQDKIINAMPASEEKNAAIDIRNDNLKELQKQGAEVQRLVNTINDDKEDLQSLPVEADLLKRNYDATTNMVGRLGASTASLGIGLTKAAKDVADMGLMLADFTIDKVAAGTGMELEEYKEVIDYAQKKSTTAEEYLDAANEYINTNIRGNLRKARSLDDLESFTDWAQWTGDLFADQIPQLAMIMASGGNAGLYLLAGSAYGNKLNDMEKEMSISQDVYNNKVKELSALPKGSKEYEEKEKELESLKKSLKDYDFWQLRGTAAMVGAGEFLSEKVTQGILKRAMGSPRMYGALGKIDKGKLSSDFKRSAAKNYKDKLSKAGIVLADPFMEGGSEVFAQINENIADKFIMGKDVSLWEGVPDAFVSGLFIGGGIKIAGGTMGLVMKDFVADKNKTISKNLQEIKKLTDMVATLQQQEQTDVTKLQIDIANTAIAQREIQNGQMILSGLDVLNRLSADEIREVSRLNDDVSKIRDEYRKISEATNITEEQKAGLIEALEKQYNDVVTRKDDLMKIGQSKDSRYIINNKEVTAEEMKTFLESEENINKVAEGETNIKIFNDTTLEKDFAKKMKAKAPVAEEVVKKDPLWKRLFSGKKAKTKLDKETDAELKQVEKEIDVIAASQKNLRDQIKELETKTPEATEEIQKLRDEEAKQRSKKVELNDKAYFLNLGIKNPTQQQLDLMEERHDKWGKIYYDKKLSEAEKNKALRENEKLYEEKILALEKPFDPTKEEAPVAEEVVEEKAVEEVAEDAGDVAAEYRKAKEDFLKDNPDTPQSVIDVMDNMIRSAEELDAKTKEAPIEEQAEPYEQWLEGYKERTGQFLKENPDLGQGAKDAINNMMEQAESVVEKSKDEEVKEKADSAKQAETKKKPPTRAGILKEIQKRLKPTADIYLKNIPGSKAQKTQITREIKLAINDIKNKYRGKWKTMNEAELQEVLDKLKDLETKGKEQRKAIEKSQEAKRKEMIAESAVLIEKSGKNIATPIPLETDTEIAAFKKNVLSKDEGRYSNPEAAFIVDGKAMMHAEMKALIESGELEYKNIQVLEATTKNNINESNKRIRIEDWIYPPSAKDLETLLYALYGKGKEGKAFFEKHILNTLDKAVVDEIIMSQEFLNEYKKLEKKYLRPRNIKELVSNQMNKKTGIKSVGKTPMDITVGEAIYLYNFIKDPRMYTKLNQGNIDMAVMDKVVDYMNKNPRYKNYADGLVDLYAKFRDDIEISLDAEGYDTFGRPTYSSYDDMVDFYYEQNKGKMSDTEAMDLAKKEADKTQDLLVKIYGGADKIPQNIPYTPSRVDSNTDEMSVDDILDPNGFNKAMTVITGNLVAKTEGGAVEWRGVIPADIAYQYSKGVIHAATFLKFFSQSNAVLVSNLKRIEDLKGEKFAKELKLSLGRIITNSRTYQQKIDWFNAAFNDYINGSQGVIMFLNMKSAGLQILSTANFMVEIGPEKYFSAMKHINKKDATEFIKSPYVKQRIGGAAGDVMIDEIINTRGGGVRQLYAKLMQAGYSLTKAADVSAIVIGGLPYYQAKKQQYLSEMKNGKAVYTEAQAKEKAMVDFVRASEKGQQSKMLRMLSSQQIIPSTKMLLAFANVPLQYNRLMYQAASDIKNRRGNMMGNVLKIGYYLTAQNLFFSALQQGLFAAFLSGDDEELDKKTQTTLNSFANTLLRGLGVTGALAAMLKDIALYTLDSEDISEIEKQERQEEIVMGIAPPIGYKLSQWRRAARDLQYAKTEEEMTKAEIKRWSVITNLPANRVLLKYEALSDAGNSQYELWERLFRFGGWSRWSLGMDPTWKEKQKLEKINKELKTIPTPVPIPVPVPVPVPTPVSVP